MKPSKYSKNEANKIDLGTKIILKYPTPTKSMDVGKMIVKGRYPQEEGVFYNNRECSFVIYVISGKGTVYAGKEVFAVVSEDVVFVPTGNSYAVDGDFEYITFDTPAYYEKQSTKVQK